MPTREEKIAEVRRLRKVEELKALRAGNAPIEQPKTFGEAAKDFGKSALEGVEAFGAGVSEAIPLGGLARKAAAGTIAAFGGGEGEDFGQRYESVLRQEQERLAAEQAKSPVAATAGQVVGAVGGSAALPIPGAGAKGITGAATRVAGTAGMGALDAYSRDQDALQAATVGGGIQTGLEVATPFAARLAKTAAPLYNKLVGKLKDSAASRASNVAFSGAGKVASDVEKGRGLVKTGRQMLDEGLVTPVTSAKTLAKRATSLKEGAGQEIQKIGSKIDDAFPDGVINGDDIAQRILDYAAKIPETEGNKLIIDRLMREAENYAGKGPLTFKKAQEFKGAYKFKPTDSTTQVLGQDATNAVRGFVSDAMEDAAAVVAKDIPEAAGYVASKQKYGLGSDVQKGAKKQIERQARNQSISLTDVIAATGGAGYGAMTGGSPEEAAKNALIFGSINNLRRNYGAGLAAVGLDKLANLFSKGGAIAGRFSDILANAAQRGQAAFLATHSLLMKNEPEYRKMIEQQPKEGE